MYWAVEKGNVAMVKLLLSANPDLEISTKVSCLRPKHVVGNNWRYIYIYIFILSAHPLLNCAGKVHIYVYFGYT